MSEKSQKSSPKLTSARTSSAKLSGKQSSTYEIIRNSSHNSIAESQRTTSIAVNNDNQQASNVEAAILAATKPFEVAEKEVINVNGITGLWANKSEAENWNGPLPLKEYPINNDNEPEVIKKRTDQTVIYEHEVAIRYLRPPTPPPPGELIIKQEKAVRPPPAPPVVIRQQPRKPETPPPLVVREEPPKPPRPIPPKVITVPGKKLPPIPRKLVIERFGALPDKPRPIVIERWLPYGEQKRKIVYMKPSEPESPIETQKNLIIEWEAPQVLIKKEFRDLGIIKVNPLEYYEKYNGELKPSSELPPLAQTIQPPAGYTYAAEAPEPPVKLEGDIEALKLIDLEANGLSEYKYLLETNAITRSPNNENTSLADVFATIDINQDGKISIAEAESLLVMLNNSLGRKYSNDDVKTFFSALDANKDGYVDYEDFKNAFSSALNDA